MRAVRHVFVALIAFALAFAPVAGFAKMMPMQHEMSAGAPEDACSCRDASRHSTADVCLLKCCGAVAILVQEQPMPEGLRVTAAEKAVAALSPFARRPDPPPPRS
jgi:hypothetical protein